MYVTTQEDQNVDVKPALTSLMYKTTNLIRCSLISHESFA